MWTENKNVRSVRTFVIIILGNMLYALIVKLFLLPGNLMTGGTTGIGLLVKRYTEISLAGFVLIFNLIMLAAGFVLLGKKFALTTVISSLAYPIFLEVFDRILGEVTLTEEPILNTIFSGLGIGLALGLVIRTGASTGGMDIPPLVLHKYFRIPVSVSLNFFDMLILAGQAVYNPAERILYGEGGYLQEETQVVLSILYNRELPKVERLIRDIDPEAFMIVSRVTEVRGKGFSISKDYR